MTTENPRAPAGRYDGKLHGPPAEITDDTTPNPANPWADAETVLRTARVAPSSWDPEAYTVEVVAATETPVARRDSSGPFAEVLTMAALHLGRTGDLPVYDSHRGGTARATIGIVRSMRVEGDRLVAVLRLSQADDAQPIVQRVSEGTIRGVSIGYSVRGWTTSTAADGTRTKRPTAWAVAEISLTPEPADPNARVRSTNGPDATAQSGSLSSNSADDGGHDMPKDTIDEAEITRRKTIRTLCRAAGMGSDFADDLIDSDATETEAKAAIHDAAQTRRAPVIRTAMPQNDDPAVIMQRQSDALAYRMGGGDLTDESRPYAEQSLFDMARDAVQRSGASVRGISRDEILHRAAHGTSDFPLIVSNAAGKTAQAAYQAAESPLKQLCRKQTLRDFKTSTAIKLGEFGELVELPESGEFQATSAGETGESMALKTFGRRVDLSRNLIINDDLGLFGSTVAAIGQAAAQTEATQLVALITDNPTMSDGTAVFDASRGNVAGTAGVPSTTTLSAAREAMRKRTGTDGEMLIDAAPKFLLVDPSLETTAEEILATIQPNTTDAVNVFAGKLTLLVEPRLPEGFWYLFSDPSRLASMRYAYLSGAEGVQIQRREAWDTLGVSFRAYLDWGAGWLDWRGAHRVAES